MMTEEEFLAQCEDVEMREWYAARPERVREVMRRVPPFWCYRTMENDGHYKLYSYDEQTDGKITLRIIHGSGDRLAGIYVFGIDPETLIPCRCGTWQWPDADEVKATREKIELIKLKQRLKVKS